VLPCSPGAGSERGETELSQFLWLTLFLNFRQVLRWYGRREVQQQVTDFFLMVIVSQL